MQMIFNKKAKPLYKRNIVVFTAREDNDLTIFNYPEKIPVKKGDQGTFQIRVTKPSKIIAHTMAK